MHRIRLIVAAIVLGALVSTGGLSVASSVPPPSSQSMRTTRIHAASLLKTFSSTSGAGTTVKITKHGNVVGFASPTVSGQDVDHIDAGTVTEGYVVCYTDPNTLKSKDVYDVASGAHGFGAATTSTNPLTVTRTIKGGLLKLTQTFTFNGPSRSLGIVMTLQNVSGTSITGVTMRRQVDIDADAGGQDGTNTYNNIFGGTQGSVFGYNDGGGLQLVIDPGAHGLMLRSLATSLGSTKGGGLTGTATTATADTSCVPNVDPTPTVPKDDGASFLLSPHLTLAPGEKLTETLEYDAI